MKNSENQRDGYLSTHIFIWLVVWNSPGPKSCQRVGPRWPILGWLGLPFDSLLPWMRSLLHKPDSRLEFTLSLRSLACIVRWLGQSVACCLWRCCWPWTRLLQGGRSRQCLLLAWSEHVLVGRVSVGTSSCARICEDAMDGHCLHANFVRVCKPASYAWPSFLLSQCCGDWSSDASTVCFFSNFGRPPTHWKLQACCQLWLLQGWPAHPFLQCLLLRCLLWRERASVGNCLATRSHLATRDGDCSCANLVCCGSWSVYKRASFASTFVLVATMLRDLGIRQMHLWFASPTYAGRHAAHWKPQAWCQRWLQRKQLINALWLFEVTFDCTSLLLVEAGMLTTGTFLSCHKEGTKAWVCQVWRSLSLLPCTVLVLLVGGTRYSLFCDYAGFSPSNSEAPRVCLHT